VRSILLAEDDDFSRDVLTQLLRAEGYHVTAVANGREALDCLRRADSPDLILLDLVMPVLDGWEFCRRHSRDPRLASIPVLVVSGADPGPALLTGPLRVAGYLRKPVRVRELLDRIRCC
jgi:CheY-like chemotaxis protein